MLGSERKLSDKQQRILEYIREFVEDHPYPPSVREIQQACKISSTSVVDYNLRLLQRDGIIRRAPEISRGIELVDAAGRSGGGSRRREAGHPRTIGIPVLGYVAAGSRCRCSRSPSSPSPWRSWTFRNRCCPGGSGVRAAREGAVHDRRAD